LHSRVAEGSCLLHVTECVVLSIANIILLDPEDEGTMILWNIRYCAGSNEVWHHGRL